jgi:hypothetical protein
MFEKLLMARRSRFIVLQTSGAGTKEKPTAIPLAESAETRRNSQHPFSRRHGDSPRHGEAAKSENQQPIARGETGNLLSFHVFPCLSNRFLSFLRVSVRTDAQKTPYGKKKSKNSVTEEEMMNWCNCSGIFCELCAFCGKIGLWNIHFSHKKHKGHKKKW